MKSEQSLSKSAKGALIRAECLSIRIQSRLEAFRKSKKYSDENKHGELMSNLRADLAELNQRVHEYNAYNNALTTE